MRMSNQQVSVVDNLMALEKPFEKQNSWELTFENECLFARQQIMKSDYTVTAVQNNPSSLRSAILNVAAVGISLNPASAHAYLVPRKGVICLDVSYRGLVKLATDAGAIEWAKAVLVYEGDTFNWRGPAEAPEHVADVFDDKRIDAANPLNNLKGGYCLAKLVSGGFMVDVMTAGEILEVRDSSMAKTGPWKGKWAGEMAKKTLVKRASKSWPQSNGRQRLDQAIEILNEHEGLEPEPVVARKSDYMQPTAEQTATYLELAKGDSVSFYLWNRALDERLRPAMPGCEFEPRKKGEMMAYYNGHMKNGQDRFNAWVDGARELCDSGDESGLVGYFDGFEQGHLDAVIVDLNPAQSLFAQQSMEGPA
jgi:phage RecT family recombinase